MEKSREVKYLVCDGCGYSIGAKQDAYMMLILLEPGKEETTLHFHLEQKPGEGRTWGTRNCLHYWVTSRIAHGHVMGWDGRDVKTTDKYIRDVVKNPPAL